MITWESNKEQIFEMPTGGAAIMRKGPNLLKFARKEQCLALTTQLRNKFKFTPCFYRVYPSGEVQYMHPKDGVYPEKVNAGRQGVNQNFRRIGENVNPIKVRLACGTAASQTYERRRPGQWWLRLRQLKRADRTAASWLLAPLFSSIWRALMPCLSQRHRQHCLQQYQPVLGTHSLSPQQSQLERHSVEHHSCSPPLPVTRGDGRSHAALRAYSSRATVCYCHCCL